MAEHGAEITLTLRLSKTVREKLAVRAAETGRTIAAVVGDLIEQSVTRPNVDEALAPFRKQVAESGMSDEELDDLFRNEIEARRREKKPRVEEGKP